MKRSGTLTVPYTFCLICGLCGLVVIVVGMIAWFALRDARDSEPTRAAALLNTSMAPVEIAVSAVLNRPTDALATLRQWSDSGLIPAQTPLEWPPLLLPGLDSVASLQSIWMVHENGASFYASRSAGGWSGSISDPGDPFCSRLDAVWDGMGRRSSQHAAVSAEVSDPRRATWYLKTESLPVEETVMLAEPGEPIATLATPVRFPGGQRGCVALNVDTSPIWKAAAQSQAGEILVDPEGDRLSQIQDIQTLELVESKVVSASHDGALAQLFSGSPSSGPSWYKANRVRVDGGHLWWIVGRINASALPSPAGPVLNYLSWVLGLGLAGATLLALLLGGYMTRPLRQVAARARSIHVLDEHYVPWPTSRFTEVNLLTSALEEIYETAVEHLDYHDAPLVVWAQPEDSEVEGVVDADAIRHVFQYPRSADVPREMESAAPTVIDVESKGAAHALPNPIPAAQLQVLQGTRKELRRLQSQLAGACEELRTADNHYQHDQSRIKRQRNCLRGFERLLLSEGAAAPAPLIQIKDVLSASRVSIWTLARDGEHFHLAGSGDAPRISKAPLAAPFALLALMQTENLVVVQEPLSDPRLAALSAHPFFDAVDEPKLLAPVKLAGKLLGFFIAERPTGHGRWKGDEELFVSAVVHACAGVLWHQLRLPASEKMLARSMSPSEGAPHNGNGRDLKRGGQVFTKRHRLNVPVLFWEIDRAGCIKSIEGDVALLYGRTRESLIGQPITFLSDVEQGKRDLERLAALLSGHRCEGYETSHMGATGETVQLMVRAKVWRDASDRVVGARGSLEPIPAAIAS